MRLTVIGCSGSVPSPSSAASSYLVRAPGRVPVGVGGAAGAGESAGVGGAGGAGQPREGGTAVLLDLGSGAFGPLQAAIDPGRLDAVVLSHLHPDHCSDLTALEVWLRYGPAAPGPRLRVLGPVGLRERLLELTHTEESLLEATFAVELLTPGVPVTVGSLTITPHEALHPVPALCFAITGPSQTHDGVARLAYTGDTDLCEGVARAASGVDLLLSEAAFAHEEEVRGIHLTGRRAGTLARDAGAGALVLTHLQPWADAALIEATAREAFGREVSMAEPGATWTL